jgi:hypothetical protein
MLVLSINIDKSFSSSARAPPVAADGELDVAGPPVFSSISALHHNVLAPPEDVLRIVLSIEIDTSFLSSTGALPVAADSGLEAAGPQVFSALTGIHHGGFPPPEGCTSVSTIDNYR